MSWDFWCGGVSKPMPVVMAVSTDLINFNVISQDETASSTFQVPVWSLGTQPETKVSWELLKSKCPLIFEAFSADDRLFIGNGHGDTEE